MMIPQCIFIKKLGGADVSAPTKGSLLAVLLAIYESGKLGDGGVVFSLENGMENTRCILGKLGDDGDVISHKKH